MKNWHILLVLSVIFIMGCTQNRTEDFRKTMKELQEWKRPRIELTKQEVDDYFKNN